MRNEETQDVKRKIHFVKFKGLLNGGLIQGTFLTVPEFGCRELCKIVSDLILSYEPDGNTEVLSRTPEEIRLEVRDGPYRGSSHRRVPLTGWR